MNKNLRANYLNNEIRLENMEFIKAILMLAVVVGHCVAIWTGTGWFNNFPAPRYEILVLINEFVSSFHIYGFVLISGYLYAYLRYDKKKYEDFKDFVVVKAKRLLLPYVFVSLIWAVPFYNYFFKPEISIVIKNYVLAVSPSQLWFLWMLFGVFIIERTIGDKLNVYMKLVFSALVWGVGFIGSMFLPNYFQVFNSMQYYVFFALGTVLRKISGGGKSNSIIYLI